MDQRERDALDRHITGDYGERQHDEDVEDPFDFPDPTPEQLEEIRAADLAITGLSTTPTRYAVICPEHDQVFITKESYIAQMWAADSYWKCPRCGSVAGFDDDNYERDDL